MFTKEFLELIFNHLNDDNEICGPLYYDQNRLLTTNIFFKGQLINGRKACVSEIASEIDYHTHPQGSKWYPSGEDLCKVSFESTRRNLLRSFIFNPFGYWIITLINEKYSSKKNHKEEIARFLNQQISKILHIYGRGKELPPNKDPIIEYINSVENILDNINLQFISY